MIAFCSVLEDCDPSFGFEELLTPLPTVDLVDLSSAVSDSSDSALAFDLARRLFQFLPFFDITREGGCDSSSLTASVNISMIAYFPRLIIFFHF